MILLYAGLPRMRCKVSSCTVKEKHLKEQMDRTPRVLPLPQALRQGEPLV